MLRLEQVGFRYQDRPWLFRALTYQFPDAATVAVVGPSGSGKTTLLALLEGDFRPSEGEVHRGPGRSSWIFQSPSLLPHRSASDNAALPMIAQGRSWAQATARANALLGEMGLAGFEGHQVRFLSGGQAQRVVVARSLAGEPAIILADEPTASLDRVGAEPIGAALRKAADRGATVVVATHDQRLAETCDHILELAPPLS